MSFGPSVSLVAMAFVPPARHLLRAKDLADARYFEPLDVDDLAAAAGLSRAHFSREFRRTFGESPHAYLLTRRLERAAALLRNTDRTVADVCVTVGSVRQGDIDHALLDPEATWQALRGLIVAWYADAAENLSHPGPEPPMDAGRTSPAPDREDAP
jgi:AraC-like DNA-binding protein